LIEKKEGAAFSRMKGRSQLERDLFRQGMMEWREPVVFKKKMQNTPVEGRSTGKDKACAHA